MEKKHMKTKNYLVSIATFAVLSGLLATALASAFPNLPSAPVTMNVADGSTSYFVITLSDVPAGYDVSNGAYPGWCLHRGKTMSRGVPLTVTLYSSLDPPESWPPKPWNQVNYILNNKQGTVADIQQAIWHLMGYWNFENLTPTAQVLVNEANSHSDFVPTYGQIVGVICFPADENEQVALIEVVVPPLESGYTPGFWKHNIGVALGYNRGAYSAFRDGTKLNEAMLQGYATTVGVTLEEAYEALTAHGFRGANVIRADMANAFNEAAGYGPFED